jgi:hypothetical protein
VVLGEVEELVVELVVEIVLLLVEVGDSETQRTWPIDKSQLASRVGLKA